MMVDVEARMVDASGSYSTKFLLDKSDVDNFSKNVFQALDSNVSWHVEL